MVLPPFLNRFRSRSGNGVNSLATERDQKSTLECVVDMLKGTLVLIRFNHFQSRTATLWLTPDMKTLMWREQAKTEGKEDQVYSLSLAQVKRLNVLQRQVTIHGLDNPKSIHFVMPSREKASNWEKGLRSLIPEVVTGHLLIRHSKPQAPLYDPLLDVFEGKALSGKRRIGEFILLGSIGRGAFGTVKLALSSQSRRFYAVKVLSKNIIRRYNRNIRLEGPTYDSETADMVAELPEISVLRRLEHQNVVKLKEVINDVTHDCLCIVTEYLPNGSVMSSAKLAGMKPLSESRAKEAFVDVLTGLHYLQSQSVVHRDIKPDNLLAAGDGTVKITDFGSAKAYHGPSDDDDDSSFPTVGTPAFTAPEMCMSEDAPPKPARAYAADLWSLGATLFYMIYGQVPFQARSVFEMFDAICKRDLEFPNHLELHLTFEYPTQECVDVILSLLQKNPEDRPSFEKILRMPWLSNATDIKMKVNALQEQLQRLS